MNAAFTPQVIAIAAVALVIVLWQKGYFSRLPLAIPNIAPVLGNTSDVLFERAIKIAITEAQDAATQKLVATLKAEVVKVVTVPFTSAAPAPAAPAPAAPVAAMVPVVATTS